MEQVLFTIIVVALNPGEKLSITMNSILRQTFSNYQVIIKDGMSTDQAVNQYEGTEKVLLKRCKDQGIYDAMNQALCLADGRYTIFMNCGDCFENAQVLEKTAEKIEMVENAGGNPGIFYGDTRQMLTNDLVAAPKKITSFVCFRNIPCHQSCFYKTALLQEKPFDLSFPVRADYEQFLGLFYEKKLNPYYLSFPVSAYEGGGFSESRENRKQDKMEHDRITRKYMKKGELFLYHFYLFVTFMPLRKKLSESRKCAAYYQKLKRHLYGRKK